MGFGDLGGVSAPGQGGRFTGISKSQEGFGGLGGGVSTPPPYPQQAPNKTQLPRPRSSQTARAPGCAIGAARSAAAPPAAPPRARRRRPVGCRTALGRGLRAGLVNEQVRAAAGGSPPKSGGARTAHAPRQGGKNPTGPAALAELGLPFSTTQAKERPPKPRHERRRGQAGQHPPMQTLAKPRRGGGIPHCPGGCSQSLATTSTPAAAAYQSASMPIWEGLGEGFWGWGWGWRGWEGLGGWRRRPAVGSPRPTLLANATRNPKPAPNLTP